jgi:hypothetical protein
MTTVNPLVTPLKPIARSPAGSVDSIESNTSDPNNVSTDSSQASAIPRRPLRERARKELPTGYELKFEGASFFRKFDTDPKAPLKHTVIDFMLGVKDPIQREIEDLLDLSEETGVATNFLPMSHKLASILGKEEGVDGFYEKGGIFRPLTAEDTLKACEERFELESEFKLL